MQIENIRNAVRNLYDRVGDVAKPAILVRKSFGTYIPGASPVATLTEIPVRLIETATPTSRSLMEDDGISDKAYRVGLLECEKAVPEIQDDLKVSEKTFIITQVAPMDLGAGILFEVWYQ